LLNHDFKPGEGTSDDSQPLPLSGSDKKESGKKRKRPKRSELDEKTLIALRIRDAARKRKQRRAKKELTLNKSR